MPECCAACGLHRPGLGTESVRLLLEGRYRYRQSGPLRPHARCVQCRAAARARAREADGADGAAGLRSLSAGGKDGSPRADETSMHR